MIELCSDFYCIPVVSGNSTLFELQYKHIYQEEFEDYRYKRGNQNPYIEEEQTTQWPKEKVQKD